MLASSRPPIRDYRPNPLRQGLRFVLSAILPRRLFLVSGSSSSGQVCLTFDDGPDPEHTPPLLDELRRLDVRATFFVIGEAAARHPEIVERMAAEGHEVGNHTWSHQHPHSLSTSQFSQELLQTSELIQKLAGQPCRWFRPPHGKVRPPQLWRTWKSGQSVVLWNNDPKDYARSSGEELESALRAYSARAGDIVLMHDNRPYAAAALPAFVQDVRSRHLSFVTLRDWLPTT